jgi:hypothetical protein
MSRTKKRFFCVVNPVSLNTYHSLSVGNKYPMFFSFLELSDTQSTWYVGY